MTFSVCEPHWAPADPIPSLLLSPLSHLGLIQVTGEQNRTFIHGQVTADITGLAADQWCWGAHCDPKGKMLSAFRAFAIADALMMLLPKDTLASDLPEFKKYAVFSKAELTDVSEQWCVLGVAGTEAFHWLQQHFPAYQGNSRCETLADGVIIKDGARFLLILPTEQASAMTAAATLYSHQAWQALEILSGYANLPAVHKGQFVPQMANLQALDGICFTKGCYMGQETVARMKYRGGNKRALYILQGTANQPVTPESTLLLQMAEGHRPQGTILEVAQFQGQLLLTAVLPNDTEAAAHFTLEGDDSAALTVRPLPYEIVD